MAKKGLIHRAKDSLRSHSRPRGGADGLARDKPRKAGSRHHDHSGTRRDQPALDPLFLGKAWRVDDDQVEALCNFLIRGDRYDLMPRRMTGEMVPKRLDADDIFAGDADPIAFFKKGEQGRHECLRREMGRYRLLLHLFREKTK